MILYFLRHANAGESKQDPKKDDERGLDPSGVAQCYEVARLFSRLEVVPDIIITSPLKRAMQTAAMVANEIGYDDRLRVNKALLPDARWEDFGPMLKSHPADIAIVVGHSPNLGQFVGRLIAGKTSKPGSRANVDLKKGGVARVEFDGRIGELQWLLTPRLIREANAGFPPEHAPQKPPKVSEIKLQKNGPSQSKSPKKKIAKAPKRKSKRRRGKSKKK